MKIGFLTPEFPHPSTGLSGGIGTSILNLSKGLINHGHQVSILVYGQDKDDIIEEELTIYKIKNIKVKLLSRFLTQKKIEKLINKLVLHDKMQIIEAPDWTGFTSFIRPKCPVVIRLNGSDTYFCHLDKRPVKFINKFHEGVALKNADGLISVSQYTANLTKQLFKLKSKITIIPNSIDVDRFSVATNKYDELLVLYFGTLIRKKGLFELPKIFNEIYKINNQVRLTLVGKDSGDVATGRSSTWELIQPLFDKNVLQNVDYLGSVSYNEIKQQINRATVCVFPTFAEALPVSWIEAMAMEKAVVASDIGWAIEVIDNEENGFLVNPKDHKKYAKRILDLIDQEDLRIQFGKNARKKVEEKFSINVVANQSISFYQKVIESKK